MIGKAVETLNIYSLKFIKKSVDDLYQASEDVCKINNQIALHITVSVF